MSKSSTTSVCTERCCAPSPPRHGFEDDLALSPCSGPHCDPPPAPASAAEANMTTTASGATTTTAAAAGDEGKTKGDTMGEIMAKAGRRALGGGTAGALAMVLQVGSLMWLRTTVNYQLSTGVSTMQAFRKLYADGGVRRFYRGAGPALLQGPLSRFGDTAANVGVLALMSSERFDSVPIAVKTLTASFTAALWRINLMPIDTTKTTLQVAGKDGIALLKSKIKIGGPRVLYAGALGSAAATFAGHAPWFFTFNSLDAYLPKVDPEVDGRLKSLGRTALMGWCSSAVSDTVSNSIRVLKVTKQTSPTPITYPQAFRSVVNEHGYLSLFGRGLKTKILANGVQGLMFAVLWKEIQQILNGPPEEKEAKK